jgi:hypothetical protein
LPASEDVFWARKAFSLTVLKCAASPVDKNMVPSAANLMPPPLWEGPSAGRQSAPTGALLQDGPFHCPRITTSVLGDAVSPFAVNLLRRPVLVA